MGCHPNIDAHKFPKQGDWLGRRVLVCFHFDTSKTIPGTIVREDEEEPGKLIIKLANGRYVEAGECQYQLMKD